MRTRLNWQCYLVWPDALIGKIQQPGKYFGRRTNLTSTLIVVSPERHVLEKIYQTIPVWETVEGRKKIHFKWRVVFTFLPTLSHEFINSYHSFSHLWANSFTAFSLHTWCHLTERSSALFPDRMGYKKRLRWGNRLPACLSRWERGATGAQGPSQMRGRAAQQVSTASEGKGNG